MTKEICITLTTGDYVNNLKKNIVYIVAILSQPKIGTVCIEDILLNLNDWELFRSRLVVTAEQKKNIIDWDIWCKEHEIK